jgi:stage II sporulation protein AA (anti-sigma F factor antagonist)
MNTEVLHVGVRDCGDTRVLSLAGELDSYSSERIMAASETWINGANRVSVCLDDLQYIDSSGLSALVWMWTEARDRGVEMVISCNSPRVHRVLEITGLLKLFTLESATTTCGTDSLQSPMQESDLPIQRGAALAAVAHTTNSA